MMQEPKKITRRDFLDGVLMAGGSAALGGTSSVLRAQTAEQYPPALSGLRGSHVGSFETLHRLREEGFWKSAPAPQRTGESYDLVIVGAGISGLTAAYAYRKARPGASVLILDNHDDFGGHAKRNEFGSGADFRIGHGGSQSISSPAPYSAEAKALVAELGVDVASYARYWHGGLYRSLGLRQAFHFDRERFGTDRLVTHGGRLERDAAFIAAAPLSDAAKRDLVRLTTELFDPYPGTTEADKRARLARISYSAFLLEVWKVDQSLLPLFDTRTHGLYGVGMDAVPAQDAHGLGLPGFLGLGLGDQAGPGQNLDSIRSPEAEDYFFHFPDGNATLARLLVRRLIPAVIPAADVERTIGARARYHELDRPEHDVRIRLTSAVLRVRHVGDAAKSREVEVTYQHGARLRTVTAPRVILACWHTVIPYICPELPAAQREALGYGIKVPVVYTNVVVRNWTAWQRLGVSRITSPGFWHTSVGLDFPVSMGDYRFPQSPEEPIVLRLSKAACRPGLPVRDQHRAGRAELYALPFETIERSIRDQLDRLLGAGGFEASRDITAITVNRWPHGYTYQYNSLFDAFWGKGGTTPCEIARQRFGRIAIANADAAAYGYADAAMDHGLRAAGEAMALR
jgi:spermidine dehydrogenase